ncbi:hypothetical protein K458DRAFT_37751 [Lentithecium fluviatile CBS 122367]|uniref:Uncharacterized protein n=1 Tax=Lentithecium fluviatile CBS 122367 TaxID=1168545 RepID=A0A6G1J1P0_9PLEO|nr:hypothetical protein K458DRAFT_37751 [Lentithecium fluviatile CBS 122367]
METSPYGAQTPSDAASHQPTDHIQLYKAVDDLVKLGLSKEKILLLSKLGLAGIHAILDVFEGEGRQAVDGLLRPLEGVSDDVLRGWVDAIVDKQSESGRGRRQSRLPSRNPIDNKPDASTATPAPASTPHLHPPPSFHHSSSTRTRSESPASTNLTYPSSQKRLRVTPKTTRKQLYCPDCGTAIKNGFEKHFKQHLQYLFAQNTVGESDLIGCGYCPCNDLELDQGKAFPGVSALLRHIHEEHTQADSPAPVRLQWDVNSSFKNVLTGEVNFRRHFLALVKEKNRWIANKTPPYNVPPTLSWPHSPDTRRLLDELQALGSRIFGVPFTHLPQEDEFELKNLLIRAYDAAHKWQPSSSQLTGAPPQLLAPTRSPQHPSQQPRPVPPPPPPSQPQYPQYTQTEDALSFAAMGQGACDTSQYPSFDDDRAFDSIPVRTRQGPTPQQLDNISNLQRGNPTEPTRFANAPSASTPAPNSLASARDSVFPGAPAEPGFDWNNFVDWDKFTKG